MMGKKVLILGVAAVQMDAVSQLKKMGCETFTCAMAKDGPSVKRLLTIMAIRKLTRNIFFTA